MPETRQQYGLPFQQLPSATRRDLTPESMVNEQTRIGRQEIQNRFTLAWDEINRSSRFVGRQKASNMRRELHTKAKQEMLQFNQKAEAQADQLDRINRLAEIGQISNPEEIKARIMFGTDVAKSMYPTPEKEESIPEQFGKLDVYSHRISQELEDFQIVGGKAPSKLAGLSPLTTAISMYRTLSGKRKPKLQVWDRTIPVKIKGEDMMGKWRVAEPEEIARYTALTQEEKAITQRKRELLGQPDIVRRRVQSGTKGGTFDDKIAESVVPQRQPTATKPKVIRQRNRNTGQERISYDGGSTWQMIG